jgi:hypothetical protein
MLGMSPPGESTPLHMCHIDFFRSHAIDTLGRAAAGHGEAESTDRTVETVGVS